MDHTVTDRMAATVHIPMDRMAATADHTGITAIAEGTGCTEIIPMAIVMVTAGIPNMVIPAHPIIMGMITDNIPRQPAVDIMTVAAITIMPTEINQDMATDIIRLMVPTIISQRPENMVMAQ